MQGFPLAVNLAPVLNETNVACRVWMTVIAFAFSDMDDLAVRTNALLLTGSVRT